MEHDPDGELKLMRTLLVLGITTVVLTLIIGGVIRC